MVRFGFYSIAVGESGVSAEHEQCFIRPRILSFAFRAFLSVFSYSILGETLMTVDDNDNTL